MGERRCVPRWTVSKEAQLQVGDHPNFIPCVVEDISTKGMRISLRRDLFPEVFSDASLVLGDALTFDVGAHVAWQEKSEGKNTYGLIFSKADEVQRKKVEQYINANFSEQEREQLNKQWWRDV
ncbi:MAG: PilZ domain-containing protein [Candidatus Omnitrophica bacterium]|nr:PilZ domain-containing protein [Candidatus Omnitrophota bacterium]